MRDIVSDLSATLFHSFSDFGSYDGKCIKLIEGEDICPKTPLYTVERLVELDLIEAPVKPEPPGYGRWTELR